MSTIGGELHWDNPPAMEVWKDYCCPVWDELGEWDSFFPSLEVARQFQGRLREHGYTFGVIAVYPCESAEDVAALQQLPAYLGLDVSNTEPCSVLHPGTLWQDLDYQTDSLLALWVLPRRYFRDRVNKCGLLSRYEDAELLRDVTRALEEVDATHQTTEGVRVLGVQEIPD